MPVRLESAVRSRTAVTAMNPLHVLIIGAGCGGLALAHGLRRAGVSRALYEAAGHRRDCAGGVGPGRSVPGQTLHQLLLTALEDQVHFGKVCTHHEQQTDGTVTAFFADASRASGQLLVAASGPASAVRAQYLQQLVPQPPAPGRRSRIITLPGEVRHATASGQRADVNTVLLDAMLLTHALAAVQAGRVGLLNGLAAYEAESNRGRAPA
jgi:2-polyprenyl-6-methoxyphenol hydroxylase-like FAD-dependent oxidoreductase